MADNNVTVNITSHPLSREENGVVFEVFDGKSKYGEMIVSKGGVRWKPARKRDHHFISWKELDVAMRAHPKR
jgi:hypothetical protein